MREAGHTDKTTFAVCGVVAIFSTVYYGRLSTLDRWSKIAVPFAGCHTIIQSRSSHTLQSIQ